MNDFREVENANAMLLAECGEYRTFFDFFDFSLFSRFFDFLKCFYHFH